MTRHIPRLWLMLLLFGCSNPRTDAIQPPPSTSSVPLVPWAYHRTIPPQKQNTVPSASQFMNRINTTELWSADGERLIRDIVLTEQLASVISLIDVESDFADAEQYARAGLLMTCAAHLSESESEVEQYANTAWQLFESGRQLNDDCWHVWIGLATLGGFSEETEYVNDSVTILEELIEAQQTDVIRPHYEYTWLILGDLHARQGNLAKAQDVWSRGQVIFPHSKPLRSKLQQRNSSSSRIQLRP